jgi:hypothetical protein
MREVGADQQAIANFVGLSFLAIGVGTLLQTWPGKWTGSSFLISSSPAAAFVPIDIAAIKAGGIPLLTGMTLVAGFAQIAFAQIVRRFRPFFPAEISGLCILLIGIYVGVLAIRAAFGLDAASQATATPTELAISAATLALMIGFNLWHAAHAVRHHRRDLRLLGGGRARRVRSRRDGRAHRRLDLRAAALAAGAAHVQPRPDGAVLRRRADLHPARHGRRRHRAEDQRMISGLQIITSRLLDARRTFIIGIALTLSLGHEIFPALYQSAPTVLQPFVSSGLVIGLIIALMLNAFFRIGMRNRAVTEIAPGAGAHDAIRAFLEQQGGKWGARRDVVERAIFGTAQAEESIVAHCNVQGPVEVEASFDEFNLDVRLAWQGDELRLPDKRPSEEEIRETEEGLLLLAGYLIQRNADRVRASRKGDRAVLEFHFQH